MIGDDNSDSSSSSSTDDDYSSEPEEELTAEEEMNLPTGSERSFWSDEAPLMTGTPPTDGGSVKAALRTLHQSLKTFTDLQGESL
jgi:hypothetical protein